MPKKDAADTVMGMLSAVGSQTRPAAEVKPPNSPVAAESSSIEPAADDTRPATVSTLPPVSPPAKAVEDTAPRTIRLRAETAGQLRAAWLEAKRDDVLLQSQDFASTLIDEALAARRRRARTVNSH
jgi:hypothetical protein